jgi:hypothetical protein
VLRGRRQARFQSFALFSPSGKLILASGNNGRLHLWKAPPTAQQMSAGPGFEIRHYQPPNPSSIHCAAFAPDEQAFFTGGTDKVIRVWALPPEHQWQKEIQARLTYVGSQVERGTDLVRIRAEMDNPLAAVDRLRPGTYVSLRFVPETASK